MAQLCITLTSPTLDENLAVLGRNRNCISMAELRADLLLDPRNDDPADFISRAGLPVILSCRREIDGGRWSDGEEERIDLLSRYLDGGFAYIDLEMDLHALPLEKKARERGTILIRSFRELHGVPSDLYSKMTSFEEDIVLGEVCPRSSEELFRLMETSFRLKKDRKVPFILRGTGDFGYPSGILAEKLGSFLTFCGEDTVRDFHELYRVEKIDSLTIINGIIGNPVSQSRSPHIHNGRYEEEERNAVYVPFLTDSPRWFMKTANLLGMRGCSVTVPFKSEIIPLVDEIDESVGQIGASNTIFREPDGRWKATNTDAYGLVKPLLDLLKTDTLRGFRAAVIGAGGAARAAVFALQDRGAEVALFNRTLSRAQELAENFGCKAYSLDTTSLKALEEYSSIIVQTSSAGMPPLENANPLDFYSFQGGEIVYDIIYKPAETKLMAAARKAGCSVLGGYRMLEEQAALQYDIFMREL